MAALRRQPDPRDPGQRVPRQGRRAVRRRRRSTTRCVKALPRAAFSYLLGRQDRASAAARACSASLLLRRRQPGRLLAADAGPHDRRTTARRSSTDLTNPLPGGQLIQPAGLVARARPAGSASRSARSFPPSARCRTTRAGRSASSATSARGCVVEVNYVGSRGSNLPVVRELNGMPDRSTSPRSRTRDAANEAFLSGSVAEPVPGPAARHDHERRHHPARRSSCGRSRSSWAAPTTAPCPAPAPSAWAPRSTSAPTATTPAPSASRSASRPATRCWRPTPARALRDKLNYLNPTRRRCSRTASRRTTGRTARRSARTFALPFGHGRKLGQRLGRRRRRDPRRLVAQRHLPVPDGLPADLEHATSTTTRPATRRTSQSQHRRDCVGRRHRGPRLPGLGHVRLLHPGRHRAAPTRASRWAKNVRYFPSTLPDVRTHDLHLMDIGIYKTFALPTDFDLQIRDRGHQRAQLHGAVEPEPGPAQRELRPREPGPQQPARHPDRRAPVVLRRSHRRPPRDGASLHPKCVGRSSASGSASARGAQGSSSASRVVGSA